MKAGSIRRSEAVSLQLRLHELKKAAGVHSSDDENRSKEASVHCVLQLLHEAVEDNRAGALTSVLANGALVELEEAVLSDTSTSSPLKMNAIARKPWFSLMQAARENVDNANAGVVQQSEKAHAAEEEAQKLRQALTSEEGKLRKQINLLESELAQSNARVQELETGIATERHERAREVGALQRELEHAQSDAAEKAKEAAALRDQALRVDQAESAFRTLREKRRRGARTQSSADALPQQLQMQLMQLRNARIASFESALAEATPSKGVALREELKEDMHELNTEIDALQEFTSTSSADVDQEQLANLGSEHSHETDSAAEQNTHYMLDNDDMHALDGSGSQMSANAYELFHIYRMRAAQLGWGRAVPRCERTMSSEALYKTIISVLNDAWSEEAHGNGLPHMQRCLFWYLDRVYEIPAVVLIVSHGFLKSLNQERKCSSLCELFARMLAGRVSRATILILMHWRSLMKPYCLSTKQSFIGFLHHIYARESEDDISRVAESLPFASPIGALEALTQQLAQRDEPTYRRYAKIICCFPCNVTGAECSVVSMLPVIQANFHALDRWVKYFRARDSRRVGAFDATDLFDILKHSVSWNESLSKLSESRINEEVQRALGESDVKLLPIDTCARVAYALLLESFETYSSLHAD